VLHVNPSKERTNLSAAVVPAPHCRKTTVGFGGCAKSTEVHSLVDIRQATNDDFDAMWLIYKAVVAAGDALPLSTSGEPEAFRERWLLPPNTHVAVSEAGVVGMYRLGANYPDLGSHVASATYAVSPAARGRGVGRALVEHSLDRARALGYMAMQFNFVVSTNTPAVKLYERLGFVVAGTLPKAFQDRGHALVDVYVMHKFLSPQQT
jgi:ribosomal protein S18 acetylase RimI-like enzyme